MPTLGRRPITPASATHQPPPRRTHQPALPFRSALPALLLLLAGAGALHAQQRYLLEETTIVPGQAAQFLPAQSDYCRAVLRGGAPACLIFGPTTFAPADSYYTLLAFGSFSHYDGGTYTSRGLSPQAAAALRTRREPTIRGNRESAIGLRSEASYTAARPGTLVLVTDLTIRPGTLPQLLAYARTVEIPEAHRAGLLSSELYQVVAGGDTNRFLLFRRFDRFAQLDAVAPFGDTVPPRGTHASTIANCVLTSRTTVMRIESPAGAAQ